MTNNSAPENDTGLSNGMLLPVTNPFDELEAKLADLRRQSSIIEMATQYTLDEGISNPDRREAVMFAIEHLREMISETCDAYQRCHSKAYHG